ncbi:MAG: amino acid adenylation domain-containing protein [Terracidiphilus sp.]
MPEPEPKTDTGLLHEWLLRSAAATPDAVAIVEEERVTTFGELLAQAQSLALCFCEHGIQPRDRIALALPKSTDAIVAIFASLLVGAIYVPLHPRWPRERIDAVLAECTARLLIDGDTAPPRIVDLRTGDSITWPAQTIRETDLALLPRMTAEDSAFILFTSGSTGRPKGVELSHRAVSVFVQWTAREFQIISGNRIACPSPLGFDLSTFDIFNMALCGATVVLASDQIVWMPRFLVQFLRESRINCWYSVPSILAGMLQEGRMAAHSYPHLRLILFAGEVFPAPTLAKLQAAAPQALCANLYGPTETNVVTWCRVPDKFDGTQILPIGRACPYAEVRIDESSGELLAGGDSLMRGYWNRPDETERCFITLQGRQYYRTGDRVSIAPDGNYLFLGRLDRQIKRRGFRIELGEIEAALLGHEDILESAAVASEIGSKGVVITAFLRLSAVGAVTLADVIAHCGRRLPPYMLPDRIQFLDAIPKGSRGKIDYLALERIAEGIQRGD